jgi:hypothetical protein
VLSPVPEERRAGGATRASGGFHFLAAQRSSKIAKDRDSALDAAMVPRQIVSALMMRKPRHV